MTSWWISALAGTAMTLAGLGATSGRELTQGLKAPREIRVVLASLADEAEVGGPGTWRLVDAWGRTHATGESAVTGTGSAWHIERRGRRLRGASEDGRNTTAWSDEPFAVLGGQGVDQVHWRGRPYRGELRYVATDTAILVVNVLGLDDYLRGVVPLEIGPRTSAEAAAVEAQAIAARSYSVSRALENVTGVYDLIARVADQVYGGADVESAVADAALRATAGQVLTYSGRVVRAPYHSTCGGTTASPAEVWSGNSEQYLRRVSDLDEAGRPWCAPSPRLQWERTLARATLESAVARHLRLAQAPAIRAARVESTTASGRVQSLALETAAGVIHLRGNDMRFALRDASGEILPSTDFSIASFTDRQLVLRGRGNGHGVGMCQWGAIGRARAGHDAARILAAYYPGTVIARLQ